VHEDGLAGELGRQQQLRRPLPGERREQVGRGQLQADEAVLVEQPAERS
jgi:hypothetical protein